MALAKKPEIQFFPKLQIARKAIVKAGLDKAPLGVQADWCDERCMTEGAEWFRWIERLRAIGLDKEPINGG